MMLGILRVVGISCAWFVVTLVSTEKCVTDWRTLSLCVKWILFSTVYMIIIFIGVCTCEHFPLILC